jgi:hypothetical protein
VGGSAQFSKYHPQVVQCRNIGNDGYSEQWKCEADLDEAVMFGPVQVTCEGYNSPDDPYVLRGSCGLEYYLEYTRSGRNEYDYTRGGKTSYNQEYYESESSSFSTIIVFIIVVAVSFFTLRACLGTHHSSTGYSGYDGYRPGYGSSSGYVPGVSTGSGGFWSGLATGGILSYLFRPRWGYSGYSNYGPGYAGYYNGSGRSTYSNRTFGSSGRSPSSGRTRMASGFGGTKRR